MITVEQVMAQVDGDRWIKFCEKWKDAPESYKKYFDLRKNIRVLLGNDALMKIVHRTRPMRILDISAGFCAFPLICRALGHSVKVTDCDDRCFNEAQSALGFWTYYHSYRNRDGWAYWPLSPSFWGQHLITALSCSPMSHWTELDWDMFFADCLGLLHPRGCLFLQPNISPGMDAMFLCADKIKGCKKNAISIEKNYEQRMLAIWKNA